MLVDSVYCDGGLLGRNPCETGGMWAWCHISGGKMINHASGIVEPHDIKLPNVSNNIAELLAMIYALDALPNDWCGSVYTDSFVTLTRAQKPNSAKFNAVPRAIREEMIAVRKRLGSLRFTLLAGHPSEADLKRGHKLKNQLPVSIWNKWCDETCNKERADYEAEVAAYERSKLIALTTPC